MVSYLVKIFNSVSRSKKKRDLTKFMVLSLKLRLMVSSKINVDVVGHGHH